jgi:bacteriophage N4 adsorption protein B
LRDRKGILTGPTVILGYFVLLNFVLIEFYMGTYASGVQIDLVLLSRGLIVDLFFMNLIFLIWRISHRIYFTARIYDWRHGLVAAPRLIVANFVNFFAAIRATHIYFSHVMTGKPLVWDKTAHSYPIKFQHQSDDLVKASS